MRPEYTSPVSWDPSPWWDITLFGRSLDLTVPPLPTLTVETNNYTTSSSELSPTQKQSELQQQYTSLRAQLHKIEQYSQKLEARIQQFQSYINTLTNCKTYLSLRNTVCIQIYNCYLSFSF